MKKIIIAALSTNGFIGKDDSLPFRLKGDLQTFKQYTSGKTVIMGRKTFQSIGRPLPNRENIILTRDQDYHVDGAIVITDMAYLVDDMLPRDCPDDDVYIIGGSEIYAQFIDEELIDAMVLTLVHDDKSPVLGDTVFPYSKEIWDAFNNKTDLKIGNITYKLSSKTYYPEDEDNEYPRSLVTFELLERA